MIERRKNHALRAVINSFGLAVFLTLLILQLLQLAK